MQLLLSCSSHFLWQLSIFSQSTWNGFHGWWIWLIIWRDSEVFTGTFQVFWGKIKCCQKNQDTALCEIPLRVKKPFLTVSYVDSFGSISICWKMKILLMIYKLHKHVVDGECNSFEILPWRRPTSQPVSSSRNGAETNDILQEPPGMGRDDGAKEKGFGDTRDPSCGYKSRGRRGMRGGRR